MTDLIEEGDVTYSHEDDLSYSEVDERLDRGVQLIEAGADPDEIDPADVRSESLFSNRLTALLTGEEVAGFDPADLLGDGGGGAADADLGTLPILGAAAVALLLLLIMVIR